jgi:hypothetical protein
MRKSLRKSFTKCPDRIIGIRVIEPYVGLAQPIETKGGSLVAGAGFEPATFGL